jgi:ABC-2 type transport system permease protein
MASNALPIADLSYRNYDGPLNSPTRRWWVIARAAIMQTIRKRPYWVFMAFGYGYYLVMGIIFFFLDRVAQSAQRSEQVAEQFFSRIVWKDQFLHGIGTGQIWMLAAALLLGAGAIANDNRANALLVYLSKPCTKLDYLIGKFVGVWVPLFAIVALPGILFYIYGVMSFRQYGFFTSDPWLLPKFLLIAALVSFFHTSLVLGISSMFNQGRLAGATYAGIYFLTNFFTVAMVVAWANLAMEGQEPPAILGKLYYASVDGLNYGLAKAILGTDGSPVFNVQDRTPMIPAPEFAFVILPIVLLSAIALTIAWRRVRAVEVVR